MEICERPDARARDGAADPRRHGAPNHALAAASTGSRGSPFHGMFCDRLIDVGLNYEVFVVRTCAVTSETPVVVQTDAVLAFIA